MCVYTVCGCVWLYVVVCGCVWLYVVVCGCVWLCVIVCGCVWLCVVHMTKGCALTSLSTSVVRSASSQLPCELPPKWKGTCTVCKQ